MTEAKRWSACGNGKCNCGYVHRDGVFALKVVGEGDHVDPYLPETERRDLIRRVTALLNAAEGITTETLEAGVVVVPVEELRKRLPALIRATAEMVLLERRKLANDQVDEELKDLSALSQTTAKMESKLGGFIEWLSRLQQNWEQPAETRITVTIDVQTCQGYHDRRVIEVEPGIGWPERMAPEVLKAAFEMEERHLNGTVKQNGGEGR